MDRKWFCDVETLQNVRKRKSSQLSVIFRLHELVNTSVLNGCQILTLLEEH